MNFCESSCQNLSDAWSLYHAARSKASRCRVGSQMSAGIRRRPAASLIADSFVQAQLSALRSPARPPLCGGRLLPVSRKEWSTEIPLGGIRKNRHDRLPFPQFFCQLQGRADIGARGDAAEEAFLGRQPL